MTRVNLSPHAAKLSRRSLSLVHGPASVPRPNSFRPQTFRHKALWHKALPHKPLHRKHHKKEAGGIFTTLIALLFLAVLCAALYLVRRPLLSFAGESWIVDETLDRADAIIVLSDDNFYADRVTRAAELIREGKAPIVVASGKRLRPYAGIAELMQP